MCAKIYRPNDELRQPGAVGTVRRRAQEVLQVLADDDVEQDRLSIAGSVDRMIAGHGPQVRTRRGSEQCREVDTP
ncbi:MAG: hypothetical protein ACRD1B_01150, partial [Thermoanaerobaculia bacterium]